jgi:hypothetical protein
VKKSRRKKRLSGAESAKEVDELLASMSDRIAEVCWRGRSSSSPEISACVRAVTSPLDRASKTIQRFLKKWPE